MQALHFTLRCRGCGHTFARSLEPPRSARDPITLYCQHCGCPNQVAPGDGVLRDHWSAATPSPPASGVAAEAIPTSRSVPSRDDGAARLATPRSPAHAPERSDP
jgi:hypothetical protein